MLLLDNAYLSLPEQLYVQAQPTPAPKPKLLLWNTRLAERLGLEELTDRAGVLSGNNLPSSIAPVALAYAGHQFGHFSPALGDGRALLLGDRLDDSDQRVELQLKGSGATPFSRGGDGKLPLGPAIREYIVSEAVHALGIPTAQSLTVVGTGDLVYRDSELQGAVLTRVADSHIRIGSFEYFATRRKTLELEALLLHACGRHFAELRVEEPRDMALPFFRAVCDRQASLIADWMSVGFIHGVMNTDNCLIGGFTLDYGPCAFMDAYESNKVFSSIDRHGRYAYANQPRIAQWNLARLAEALLPLFGDGAQGVVPDFEKALEEFEHTCAGHTLTRMRRKLGLTTDHKDDQALVDMFLSTLESDKADFTISFRHLDQSVDSDDTLSKQFGPFLELWRKRLQSEGRSKGVIAADLHAINPAFIPRNHVVEEMIERGSSGDFEAIELFVEALQHPFDAPTNSEWGKAPTPETEVHQTFCGT